MAFRRRTPIALGAVALLLAASSAAFVWDEARKEVVYLCANFTPGTAERSVIRQLDTAHFLRRERRTRATAVTILVDSAWNLGRHRCVIELDGHGIVRRAGLE
ncbi:MAG: hypothetical protein V2J24_11860 [Pseudomonadales bacterium]|jgi:hypothetical protein|nr:hypothetical protein [Pseudomonadales bacterium]